MSTLKSLSLCMYRLVAKPNFSTHTMSRLGALGFCHHVNVKIPECNLYIISLYILFI